MRQADGVLSTPRLRLPATPIIPLTIAMALVESAYLAGAKSREAGPLIRHEPYYRRFGAAPGRHRRVCAPGRLPGAGDVMRGAAIAPRRRPPEWS